MAVKKSNSTEDREIVITRILNAPRELVWEVWTNPKHVVNWWGPNGFTTTIEKMDVRPGGVWKHVMHGPDGTSYPNSSVFKEVVKPERLVFSHGGGKQGGPGAHFIATWTFEAQGGKTRVTMRGVFDTAADRDMVVKQYNALEGGTQTLGRLADYLANLPAAEMEDRDFVITRTFSAPRELVYQAFTDPKRMQQWWGPQGFTVFFSKMDLRPGGFYHYGMKGPDGNTVWGKFVYREIAAPKRLVFINSFSDEAGNITRHPMSPAWPLELLSTVNFDEQDTGTVLTIRWSLLPTATAEERRIFNATRASMQQGWTGTLDQLGAYLAECTSTTR
ncbi:MAG: SRPBCC domain-containing protein [Gammaproteobacteria bacterium]|nr:SRPBCC domain-containing protein [Gammaproteobacteria bacterium]